MTDTDPNPTAAAPAPVETSAITADTAPVAPKDENAFTQSEKDKFRANARWIMAELDWTRAGRSAEERATLNP